MKVRLRIPLWFAEWLFPGIGWRVKRWGRIVETRSFLGGAIKIEASGEMTKDV